MTELQLYKFCKGKEIDWRNEKLILWIDHYDIKEFCNLLGYDYFSEGGVEVNLQYGCIAIDLVPLCQAYDIEPTNILEKIEE